MELVGAMTDGLCSSSACVVSLTITSADIFSWKNAPVTGAYMLGIDFKIYALNHLLLILAP